MSGELHITENKAVFFALSYSVPLSQAIDSCVQTVHLIRQLPKYVIENRAGVLEKVCSGAFESWLLAYSDEPRTSRKGAFSLMPDFQKIRNCKVLEVPLSGFGTAISGLIRIKSDSDLKDVIAEFLRDGRQRFCFLDRAHCRLVIKGVAGLFFEP
jgi:hypothetical protein